MMVSVKKSNRIGKVRLFLAGIGAICVTVASCLLASMLGGRAHDLPEAIRPVQLSALTYNIEKVEKKPVEPPKKILLPTPQKVPKKAIKKIEKIDIVLKPLQLNLAKMEVATLTVPAPPESHTVTAGMGDGIYELGSVDTMPSLKHYSPPIYPAKAKGQGIEGKVVIRCLLSPGGKVLSATIIEATPAGYFEKVSLKTVKKWTFTPAKLQGENVSVYVDIPLSYTLDG